MEILKDKRICLRLFESFKYNYLSEGETKLLLNKKISWEKKKNVIIDSLQKSVN